MENSCDRSLLSMNSILKLPLEQNAKDEADDLKRSWDHGPFNFLLTRTQEKYKHKATAKRRYSIEQKLNLELPQITDDMLKALYELACHTYQSRCRKWYGNNSGFLRTPSESTFLRTLIEVIKANPKLKHLEVYPSEQHTKDFKPNYKMVVGNHVPDFLIFGLKIRKFSAVAIEIDGDSHIERWSKDELRSSHLKELKIFTLEIPNNQANDYKFISEAIFQMYRLRNGSFNTQIQRAKRLIWMKTVACQLSLVEIEEFIKLKYLIQLNLANEAEAILKLSDCPKSIRTEFKRG